jgi:hypothetical protein
MEEPAPAVEQPAAKDALDDLFGTPPQAPEAKPEVMPEPAAPAAPPAQPAKDALDDLFGAPGPAPATPAPKPAADALDDLFGAPSQESPAPAKPAAAPAPQPAPKPAPAADDPFSAVQPAGAESLAVREWVDNTGSFSVRARLVQILDGKVRLLKENGRTCTVEIHRLSPNDLAYVEGLSHGQSGARMQQLAHN